MTNSHNIDLLKLYFREPIEVKCGENSLTVHQPTIGEIMLLGEGEVYSAVYVFAGNTTSYRVQLWDVGIDWNKISDFELFCMLIQGIKVEHDDDGNITHNPLEFLFGNDCDFSKFQMYTMQSNDEDDEGKLALYNQESDILITEETYSELADYIRTMFGIHPKVEKAKGKMTKQVIIDQERSYAENKDKDENQSTLLNLISFCVNHPGFKYKTTELKDVGIFEFMDSVNRLQVYESTSALVRGSYSGFCDTSKIDKKNFDFMRDLYS